MTAPHITERIESLKRGLEKLHAMGDDPILPKDAEVVTGYDRSTLYWRSSSGKSPASCQSSCRIAYLPSELRKFMQEQLTDYQEILEDA